LPQKNAKKTRESDLEFCCILSLCSFAAENEISRQQARRNQSESIFEGFHYCRRKGCRHGLRRASARTALKNDAPFVMIRVMIRPSSAASCSRISAARRISRARSSNDTRRHSRNAAIARSRRTSTSAALSDGYVAITSPLVGFRVSKGMDDLRQAARHAAHAALVSGLHGVAWKSPASIRAQFISPPELSTRGPIAPRVEQINVAGRSNCALLSARFPPSPSRHAESAASLALAREEVGSSKPEARSNV